MTSWLICLAQVYPPEMHEALAEYNDSGPGDMIGGLSSMPSTATHGLAA
jgi:hypothetical protein